MNLVPKIQAILFVDGGEVKKTKLSKILDVDMQQLNSALGVLRQILDGQGIALIETEEFVALRVAPSVAEFINDLYKEDLKGDIGKAALETLAIILYRGPSLRSEIDFIRGVNSSTSIRALLLRGLITKQKTSGTAGFVYKPTTEALAFLGIKNIKELPNYEKIKNTIEKLENNAEKEHNTPDDGN